MNTAERILTIAERLVQTHGYNGFSYADIADELAIKKASLHYHFATKSDLALTLVARYRERFMAALMSIAAEHQGADARLFAYIDLYAAVLRDNRVCLCGMLAAEQGTLPSPITNAVRLFFEDNEDWLAGVLSGGRARGELRFGGDALELAQHMVSALEGAMFAARSFNDLGRFERIAARLLAEVGVLPN